MTDEDKLYQRLSMTDEDYTAWLWMMRMHESMTKLSDIQSDKFTKWLEDYKDKKIW